MCQQISIQNTKRTWNNKKNYTALFKKTKQIKGLEQAISPRGNWNCQEINIKMFIPSNMN